MARAAKISRVKDAKSLCAKVVKRHSAKVVKSRNQMAQEANFTYKAKFERAKKELHAKTEVSAKRKVKSFNEFLASQKKYPPAQINAVWADGAPLPSTEIFKNFFSWYYLGSKGRITENGRCTHDSLINACQTLFAWLQRETGSEASKSQRDDVNAHIESLNAEKAYYEKNVADLQMLKVLQRRHWATALHKKTGNVIGFSLCLKSLFFLDCRYGAILKEKIYPDSGLKYEEVVLYLGMIGGKPRFSAMIIHNWMKGKKLSKKEFLKQVLKEGDQIWANSIFDILGQATADNAFRDFSTLDELLAIPASSVELRRIYWKDEVLKKYILRNGEGNALTTEVFSKSLRQYGDAEYHERYTSYAIRRYVSNKLAEHVPNTDLTHIMGHADEGRTFVKYYKDPLSRVDIQGILIHDKEEDINWDQYMQPERVQDIECHLSLSKIQEIEAQVSPIEGAQERCRLRKKLRREALAQLEPSCEPEPEYDSKCASSQLVDSVERVGDLRLLKTVDQIVNERFLQDVSIILEAWEIPDFDIRTNGLPALRALIRILRSRQKREEIICYYPDEYPVSSDSDSVCGECGQSLYTMSAKWRPQHIHDCKERTLTAKYGTASYCSRCTTWLKPDEIEVHYKDHLDNLDLFCGLRKRKNTLIIGGLSPWDLKNGIYVQFKDRPTFKSHLSGQLYDHYAAGQKVQSCPHPRCDEKDQYTKTELIHHLYDIHGLQDLSDCVYDGIPTSMFSLNAPDVASQSSFSRDNLAADRFTKYDSPLGVFHIFEETNTPENELKHDVEAGDESTEELQHLNDMEIWNDANTENSIVQALPLDYHTTAYLEINKQSPNNNMSMCELYDSSQSSENRLITCESPDGPGSAADPFLDGWALQNTSNTPYVQPLISVDLFSMDGMPIKPWVWNECINLEDQIMGMDSAYADVQDGIGSSIVSSGLFTG